MSAVLRELQKELTGREWTHVRHLLSISSMTLEVLLCYLNKELQKERMGSMPRQGQEAQP
jgi:hypothetical protein